MAYRRKLPWVVAVVFVLGMFAGCDTDSVLVTPDILEDVAEDADATPPEGDIPVVKDIPTLEDSVEPPEDVPDSDRHEELDVDEVVDLVVGDTDEVVDPEDVTEVVDPEDVTEVVDPEDVTEVVDPADVTEVVDPEDVTEVVDTEETQEPARVSVEGKLTVFRFKNSMQPFSPENMEIDDKFADLVGLSVVASGVETFGDGLVFAREPDGETHFTQEIPEDATNFLFISPKLAGYWHGVTILYPSAVLPEGQEELEADLTLIQDELISELGQNAGITIDTDSAILFLGPSHSTADSLALQDFEGQPLHTSITYMDAADWSFDSGSTGSTLDNKIAVVFNIPTTTIDKPHSYQWLDSEGIPLSEKVAIAPPKNTVLMLNLK